MTPQEALTAINSILASTTISHDEWCGEETISDGVMYLIVQAELFGPVWERQP